MREENELYLDPIPAPPRDEPGIPARDSDMYRINEVRIDWEY